MVKSRRPKRKCSTKKAFLDEIRIGGRRSGWFDGVRNMQIDSNWVLITIGYAHI